MLNIEEQLINGKDKEWIIWDVKRWRDIVFMIDMFSNWWKGKVNWDWNWQWDKIYKELYNITLKWIKWYNEIVQWNISSSPERKDEFYQFVNVLSNIKEALPKSLTDTNTNRINSLSGLIKNFDNLNFDLFTNKEIQTFILLLDVTVKTFIIARASKILSWLWILAHNPNANGFVEMWKSLSNFLEKNQDNLEVAMPKSFLDKKRLSTLKNWLSLWEKDKYHSLMANEDLLKYKGKNPVAFHDIFWTDPIDTEMLSDLDNKELRKYMEDKLKNIWSQNANELERKWVEKYSKFKEDLIMNEWGWFKYGFFSRKLLSRFYDIFWVFIFWIKLFTDLLHYVANVNKWDIFIKIGLTLFPAIFVLLAYTNSTLNLLIDTNLDKFINLNYPFIPIQVPTILLKFLFIVFIVLWFVLSLLIVLNLFFGKAPKLMMSVITQDRESSKIFFSMFSQIWYLIILYFLFSYFVSI